MSGVQVHLDSSSHQVRRLGMITAEVVTGRMRIQQETLKFEVMKLMLFYNIRWTKLKIVFLKQ